MTEDEARKKVMEYLTRRSTLKEKIVAAARPMVAVLKDSGHPTSAAVLDALYFELDAIEQEMTGDAASNRAVGDALIEVLLRPR